MSDNQSFGKFLRSFTKLVWISAVAALAGMYAQEASAWGSGGSLGTPSKSGFADLQLYCDLSDVRSTATIDTKPSQSDPYATPSFKFSGQIVCAEVPNGTANPTLADAVTLQGSPPNVKAIGLFQLNQITDPALVPGMQYTETTTAGKTTRTWTFDVTGHETYPFAELLYELVPVDATAQRFCDPAEFGGSEPPVLDSNNCKALFGLQLPANAADYPSGRIVNGITLNQGVVSTFSTNTENGVEKADGFAWAPCHTQRFIGPKYFEVQALRDSSNSGAGSGLDTGIGFSTGAPLAVMVSQNDLWSAGALPRWSNADGIDGPNMYATGTDDSGQPAGTLIGSDIFGDHTEGSLTAPFGSLVGDLSGTRFVLGTSFHGDTPINGTLKLFYWDSTTPDNSGSVNVMVATDSIQCKDDSGNTIPATQGEFRVSNSVEVVNQDTLNVKNKTTNSVFSTTIVGCSNYDPSFAIQSDGSPIIDGTATKVLINGTEVPFGGFHVADSTSMPTCDNGQPVPYGLPDLKLDINQMSVINVLAPDGKCTNGVNTFKLEVGSNANGWYSGIGTVTLNKCQ